MESSELKSTRAILDRFKKATEEAAELLRNQEYQQAMALYYDASQSADEMCERFLKLLMKTAPSNAHRVLLVEILSWRLRYYTTQYDYHLAVVQTLSGLPREEWIARLETILVLSQSLVAKLLLLMENVTDPGIMGRIRQVLSDWASGIHNLVSNLRVWGISSAQAAQVMEWAFDNGIGPRLTED